MTRGVRIGKIFGVQIVMDLSLGVIAALLTWSLYVDFSRRFDAVSTGALTFVAVTGGILFFASILVHELSHSVVAIRRGIGVRRIRLFIFGGASEIESEAANPRDEFLIAVAGPLASFVLGVVFIAIAWAMPSSWTVADRLARLLGFANVLLGGFNLLPGFPLDGGRVLRSVLWRWRKDRRAATVIAAAAGRVVGIALITLGVFVILRGGDLGGLWYFAIGWFLYQAAATSIATEDFAERIKGVSAADVMKPVNATVPGDMTVQEMIDLYTFGTRIASFPVEVGGRVRGVIGEPEIAGLSAARRADTAVSAVMTTIGPSDLVEAGTSLTDLFSRESGPTQRVIVVSRGRVVGLISGAELANLFRENKA